MQNKGLMMRVLIIGKNGQLAQELQHCQPDNVATLAVGRAEIDIANISALEDLVADFTPSIIINASAYTAVDKAESEESLAFAINADAVKNMAIVAKNYGCKFIHISTDFIFDGSSNVAYQVNAQPNPLNVYGKSKLAGEQAIKEHYPEGSIIVRTSWVYSSFGSNFLKTMLQLMQTRDELGIVSDQIGCPTYAFDLARFIWKLTNVKTDQLIYHWSDSGVSSWYDFAQSIHDIALEKKMLTRTVTIKNIKTEQYPTPAKRPIFSLLDITDSYHIMPPNYWRHNIAVCLEKLKQTNIKS
jgi:dTDP-4-dehydrorhamnose reductase